MQTVDTFLDGPDMSFVTVAPAEGGVSVLRGSKSISYQSRNEVHGGLLHADHLVTERFLGIEMASRPQYAAQPEPERPEHGDCGQASPAKRSGQPGNLRSSLARFVRRRDLTEQANSVVTLAQQVDVGVFAGRIGLSTEDQPVGSTNERDVVQT